MKFLQSKDLTPSKLYEILSKTNLTIWISQDELFFKGENAIHARVDLVEDLAGDTFVIFASSVVLESNVEERLIFVNQLSRDVFLSKFYLDAGRHLVFQVELLINPGITDAQLCYAAEKFTQVTTALLEQFETYMTGEIGELSTIVHPVPETLH